MKREVGRSENEHTAFGFLILLLIIVTLIGCLSLAIMVNRNDRAKERISELEDANERLEAAIGFYRNVTPMRGLGTVDDPFTVNRDWLPICHDESLDQNRDLPALVNFGTIHILEGGLRAPILYNLGTITMDHGK